MKRIVMLVAGLSGALSMAAFPTAAVAGTCELELSMALNGCNGDNVCEQFAFWDYQYCLDNPPGTTQPGPGGA